MSGYRITTNIEGLTDDGYTRGWIVPADATDPQESAEDSVWIPANDDEAGWYDGLRRALADAGWELAGYSHQDGPVYTATIVRTII